MLIVRDRKVLFFCICVILKVSLCENSFLKGQKTLGELITKFWLLFSFSPRDFLKFKSICLLFNAPDKPDPFKIIG